MTTLFVADGNRYCSDGNIYGPAYALGEHIGEWRYCLLPYPSVAWKAINQDHFTDAPPVVNEAYERYLAQLVVGVHDEGGSA